MQIKSEGDWTHSRPVGVDETAVEAVVEAVMAVESCEPEDLQPIHGTVDAEALNTFFKERSSIDRSGLSVEFCYEGYDVKVTGSTVRLRKSSGI